MQYLCGAAHWRDIVLAVGPGVLIPRPETEGMVDIVADALQADAEQSRALLDSTWLDLGTGSGILSRRHDANTRGEAHLRTACPDMRLRSCVAASACGLHQSVMGSSPRFKSLMYLCKHVEVSARLYTLCTFCGAPGHVSPSCVRHCQ